MATSTMHATKGGIMSWMPVIARPPSVGGPPAPAERADELADPQVHEVRIGVDPRRPVGVRRHDDRPGPGLLRHFHHLVAVVVVVESSTWMCFARISLITS